MNKKLAALIIGLVSQVAVAQISNDNSLSVQVDGKEIQNRTATDSHRQRLVHHSQRHKPRQVTAILVCHLEQYGDPRSGFVQNRG